MKNIPSGVKKQTNHKNFLEKNREETANNDFFDQFFGSSSVNRTPDEFNYPNERWNPEYNKTKPQQRIEFTIFKHQDYRENFLIPNEIKKLTEEIRKEITVIKNSNKALVSDIIEIEKETLKSLPDKPGVYHVRFLEIILSILKNLGAKAGEARTWLSALKNKKKKRGSLFASLSKKKGTQYSLSQELQSSRSVQ